MAHLILMDAEQLELFKAGMEMAHAALEARARRVDPDRVISDSFTLSKIKTAHMIDQAKLPIMTSWLDLSESARESVINSAKAIITSKDEAIIQTAWETIQAFAIQRGAKEQAPRTVKKRVSKRV